MRSSEKRAVRMPPDTRLEGRSAVVIGNFDGVHRGHQAVLTEARALADSRGLEVTVLTFDPHPAFVLGGTEPPRLTNISRRAALLLEVADRVCVRGFDREFASTTPEAFGEWLKNELGAELVVVGENFLFGHRRAGDRALLVALGKSLGFEVFAPALSGDGDGRYSSSRARDAVLAGDLVVATHVLGRPHSMAGRVVHGEERGRVLGFPTANLDEVTEITPPRGVYAVRVDAICSAEGVLVEETVPLAGGVMNHGVRPTIGQGLRSSLEAHLFDFTGDLYGHRLRVHVIAKLRDERKFDGLDALKAQIARDASAARAVLGLD